MVAVGAGGEGGCGEGVGEGMDLACFDASSIEERSLWEVTVCVCVCGCGCGIGTETSGQNTESCHY